MLNDQTRNMADRLVHEHAAKFAKAQGISIADAVEAVWDQLEMGLSAVCQLRRTFLDRALQRRPRGTPRDTQGNPGDDQVPARGVARHRPRRCQGAVARPSHPAKVRPGLERLIRVSP